MRIAICDDSVTDRKIMTEYLYKYISEKNINFEVTEYGKGKTLIDDSEEGTGYDIIFLDMYMGDMLGLDIAKKLRSFGIESPIIFSTVSSEFAVESYDVKASGYLLKPFSYEKFCILLDRIIPEEKHDFYRVQVRTSVYNVPVNEITYAESQNNKCIIHRCDGSQYTVYKKLSTLHKELNRKNFLRCHQSYIVNMDYVSEAEKWFVLLGGEVIPIRQRTLSELKKVYVDYISEKTKPERI